VEGSCLRWWRRRRRVDSLTLKPLLEGVVKPLLGLPLLLSLGPTLLQVQVTASRSLTGMLSEQQELTFNSRVSWAQTPMTTPTTVLALSFFLFWLSIHLFKRVTTLAPVTPRAARSPPRMASQSTPAAGGGGVAAAAAGEGGGAAAAAGGGQAVVAGGADVVVVVVLRALALGVVSAPTDLGPRGAASADRMDLAVPAAHPRAVAIETETGPPFSLRQLRVSGNPPS
jgi:hypothetical protein